MVFIINTQTQPGLVNFYNHYDIIHIISTLICLTILNLKLYCHTFYERIKYFASG